MHPQHACFVAAMSEAPASLRAPERLSKAHHVDRLRMVNRLWTIGSHDATTLLLHLALSGLRRDTKLCALPNSV